MCAADYVGNHLLKLHTESIAYIFRGRCTRKKKQRTRKESPERMLLGAIFNCYLKRTVDLSPAKAQSLDARTQISPPERWTFQYAFELSVL